MSSDTWNLIIDRLVEAYYAHETELLPIVLPGEAEPSTTLTIAMASISAARKDCPNEIFWSLRALLNKEITENGESISSPEAAAF